MVNNDIKSSKKSKLWIYAIMLGITAVLFSSCSSQRAIRLKNKSIEEWNSYQFKELKKGNVAENEFWTIYSRKIKGTSLLEYKIEGIVKASPLSCLNAFIQDIHNQSTKLDNKKYPTYDVVHECKDSLLTYVIHDEPFPLKNTEMSVRYVFQKNEDGSTGVNWHEGWQESQVETTKKLKRIETFRGQWSFEPSNDNYCKATNSVQFDPKGMPLWLVNPMIFKFFKNGLNDIREISSK